MSSEHLRVQAQRSRARSVNAPALLTVEQWEQTLIDFKGLCAYCLVRPFDVLEHFYPIAMAGTTVKNCVPACYECNHKKRDYTGQQLVEIFGSDIIARIQGYLNAREAIMPDHPVKFKAQRPVLQNKEVYTFAELIDCLPCPLSVIWRGAGISHASLLRMRDGKRTRRDTANKLFLHLSQVYGQPLSIRNVTGLNVMVNKRLETKQGDKESSSLDDLPLAS